ncbi:MAG: N-acetyltransferase [Sphingobacteriales bacterium]|nr:MAG: N-acetyltransferase [Sphingobacteriales bacterium]
MQLPAHIPQIILQTKRLILKEVNQEIIDYVFTQWNDEDIMRYMGLLTVEQLAVDKEKQQGGYTTYRIKLKGFLFILKETNEVIGAAHYHTWQPLHSKAEIGYAIYIEEYKNKGYMKEGVKAMLDFGFTEMGLNRVEALIGSTNEPSLKLVKSFGFVQEGIMRDHYCKDGVVQDSICFSLLKREYNQ